MSIFWEVVGGGEFILDSGRSWWIYFGWWVYFEKWWVVMGLSCKWWWVAVGLFWVMVGGVR